MRGRNADTKFSLTISEMTERINKLRSGFSTLNDNFIGHHLPLHHIESGQEIVEAIISEITRVENNYVETIPDQSCASQN